MSNTRANLVWLTEVELRNLPNILADNQRFEIVSWINSRNLIGVYIYTIMKQSYKIERKEFWLDGRIDVAIIETDITDITDINCKILGYAESLKKRYDYTILQMQAGQAIVYFTINSNRHRVEFTRLPNIIEEKHQ